MIDELLWHDAVSVAVTRMKYWSPAAAATGARACCRAWEREGARLLCGPLPVPPGSLSHLGALALARSGQPHAIATAYHKLATELVVAASGSHAGTEVWLVGAPATGAGFLTRYANLHEQLAAAAVAYHAHAPVLALALPRSAVRLAAQLCPPVARVGATGPTGVMVAEVAITLACDALGDGVDQLSAAELAQVVAAAAAVAGVSASAPHHAGDGVGRG